MVSKRICCWDCSILTNIFQDSLESGTVPSRWKSANVCGVFKKGKKSDPSNYRPISLTCVASKILEHIVHSQVVKHFEHYNILTDCQHGFRSKRSTELQLILTIQDIASSVQQNKSIHAAVLDFSKAFDKVPRQRLLMKLERYGIHGNLLSWMKSFLTKGSKLSSVRVQHLPLPQWPRVYHKGQYCRCCS